MAKKSRQRKQQEPQTPNAADEVRGWIFRRPRETETPPGWAFAKGGLVGLLVIVPAVAGAVFALARLGIGPRQTAFAEIAWLTALLIGLPAVLVSGGIGRAAARAAIRAPQGQARRAMSNAAKSAAVAVAGFTLIAAIPMRFVPQESWRWLGIAATGGVIGAPAGALIGWWVARARVRLAGAEPGTDL